MCVIFSFIININAESIEDRDYVLRCYVTNTKLKCDTVPKDLIVPDSLILPNMVKPYYYVGCQFAHIFSTNVYKARTSFNAKSYDKIMKEPYYKTIYRLYYIYACQLNENITLFIARRFVNNEWKNCLMRKNPHYKQFFNNGIDGKRLLDGTADYEYIIDDLICDNKSFPAISIYSCPFLNL